MTLLVTEVSGIGILMMADSAAQIVDPDKAPRLVNGFAKVHYSPTANIALGGWGAASVGTEAMDEWLHRFTQEMSQGEAVRDVAERLRNELETALQAGHSRPWTQFKRRGVHVAGYEGDQPQLFHVHMGQEFASTERPQVENVLELYEAYRELGSGLFFASRGIHLRNGIHRQFAELWERDLRMPLPEGYDPDESIISRVEYYKPLFRQLAVDTEAINDELSVVAFDWTGMRLNELVGRGHPDRPANLVLSEWREGETAFEW